MEDARAMRAREQRKRRLETKKVNEVSQESGDGEGGRKKNRRVEWQVRCKEKRLRRRERKDKQTDCRDAEQNSSISHPEKAGAENRVDSMKLQRK